LVAPESTLPVAGNVNQFSANGRVRCRVALEPLTAQGRGELQVVGAWLPNWLHTVLYHVGSNYNLGPSLPAELDIPVLLEAGTTRIAEVDVDATIAELERFREIGRKEWLETGAVLAPVRNAVQLPGAAVRGIKGLFGSWREAASDFRGELASEPGQPPKPAWGPKEIEQMRRTALQQRRALARNPKMRAKVRASVMSAAPGMVEGVKQGVRAEADVEAWIMSHEVSEILTPEEAAALRREAALPQPPDAASV
jgi:hypothetical protein